MSLGYKHYEIVFKHTRTLSTKIWVLDGESPAEIASMVAMAGSGYHRRQESAVFNESAQSEVIEINEIIE